MGQRCLCAASCCRWLSSCGHMHQHSHSQKEGRGQQACCQSPHHCCCHLGCSACHSRWGHGGCQTRAERTSLRHRWVSSLGAPDPVGGGAACAAALWAVLPGAASGHAGEAPSAAPQDCTARAPHPAAKTQPTSACQPGCSTAMTCRCVPVQQLNDAADGMLLLQYGRQEREWTL